MNFTIHRWPTFAAALIFIMLPAAHLPESFAQTHEGPRAKPSRSTSSSSGSRAVRSSGNRSSSRAVRSSGSRSSSRSGSQVSRSRSGSRSTAVRSGGSNRGGTYTRQSPGRYRYGNNNSGYKGRSGYSYGYIGRGYWYDSYRYGGIGYCGWWPFPLFYAMGWPYGSYGYYDFSYRWYYRDTGAIDLNVKPKRTQVYLDGQLVGKTGKFDGFPGYLRLDPGFYDLVFYNEGFKTVHKRVQVHRGTIADIRFQMQNGESTGVEDMMANLPPKPTYEKRRETTPRYERVEEAHTNDSPETPPRRYRIPRRSAEESAEPTYDMRGKPATLLLTVLPADASVYLDGKFVGVAGDIQKDNRGILVNPGEHILEIVRPGYESGVRDILVEPGQALDVSIELKSKDN